MPTPFAPRIILAHNARSDLQTLARAHSTPQSLALRAQIVLRAADADTPSNVQIGHDLGCSNRTVGKWRQRYHHLGLLGLQDAPRSGRPRTIIASTRVRVISVASELPQSQNRPVTRWTLDEIVTTLLDSLHTEAISRSAQFIAVCTRPKWSKSLTNSPLLALLVVYLQPADKYYRLTRRLSQG